jgi:hypothetical protein
MALTLAGDDYWGFLLRALGGAPLHVADDARQMLAKKVLEHVELSGYVIDEQKQVIGKCDGGRGW